jgi:hypothetical protein
VTEIVNLRQARKRADRVKREETAAANRARFGRSKAERAAEQAEADKLNVLLDGAKREEPK